MNPDEIQAVNGGRPLVFRNGTVLTMDTAGVRENCDVLVVRERIEALGSALAVPEGTVEIDAAGVSIARFPRLGVLQSSVRRLLILFDGGDLRVKLDQGTQKAALDREASRFCHAAGSGTIRASAIPVDRKYIRCL